MPQRPHRSAFFTPIHSITHLSGHLIPILEYPISFYLLVFYSKLFGKGSISLGSSQVAGAFEPYSNRSRAAVTLRFFEAHSLLWAFLVWLAGRLMVYSKPLRKEPYNSELCVIMGRIHILFLKSHLGGLAQLARRASAVFFCVLNRASRSTRPRS